MEPVKTAIGLTFIVYLVAMLIIGVVAYRRTRDLSDYILGGRTLGSWVTALSAQASDMSGWLLLGLPGYAYLAGVESVWLAAGLLAGTYLNWRLVAGRLRRYTEAAGDALTLSDYLEHRFADATHTLRVLSAIFILLFFIFYTSAGLVAGGKLFNSVFGLPYAWAVLAGAGVVVAYTFLGGFLAVSWTDTIQGSMMFVALLAVPLVTVLDQGGWSAAMTAVERVDRALLDPWVSTTGTAMTAVALISLLGWGLGYFGQPHILARFMAARSPQALDPARRIAVAWTTLTLGGAVVVGVAGIGYLDPPLPDADAEQVFMRLVALLFHPVLAGIWLAAILAAIMSTADSQLLVASSALADDFYKGLLRKGAGNRELVWVGRLAVVGIALVALLLAMQPEGKVLDLVAYAWAGLGAAFGPTIALSLYWKRMTRGGALAGILTGGFTVIGWKQLSGGIFDLYELVPGVVLSTLGIIVASLLTPAPPDEIRRQFEEITGAG